MKSLMQGQIGNAKTPGYFSWGAILCFFSVAGFSIAIFWYQVGAKLFLPLDKQVTISDGRHISQDFLTKNGPYEIQISFQEEQSPQEIECLTGSAAFGVVSVPGGSCPNDASVFLISWQISESGHVKVSGTSDDYRATGRSASQFFRVIGMFNAEYGHHYQLSAVVLRAPTALSGIRSWISVRPNPSDYIQSLANEIFWLSTMGVCFLVSLMMLLFGSFRHRSTQNRQI